MDSLAGSRNTTGNVINYGTTEEDAKNLINKFIMEAQNESLRVGNGSEDFKALNLRKSEVEMPESSVTECLVCHKKLKSRWFSNNCLHKFCNCCINKWAMTFMDDDYEMRDITCPVCRNLMECSYNFPTGRIGNEFKFDVPLTLWQEVTGNFRESVHRNNLWVQSETLAEASSNFKEFTPDLYRSNEESQAHRIFFWLNREFYAYVRPDSEWKQYNMVDRPIHVIMKCLLSHYSIRSEIFKKVVHCVFKEQRDHFIHEFYAFACSFLDAFDFDEYAVYCLNRPLKLDQNEITVKPLKTCLYLSYQKYKIKKAGGKAFLSNEELILADLIGSPTLDFIGCKISLKDILTDFEEL